MEESVATRTLAGRNAPMTSPTFCVAWPGGGGGGPGVPEPVAMVSNVQATDSAAACLCVETDRREQPREARLRLVSWAWTRLRIIAARILVLGSRAAAKLAPGPALRDRRKGPGIGFPAHIVTSDLTLLLLRSSRARVSSTPSVARISSTFASTPTQKSGPVQVQARSRSRFPLCRGEKERIRHSF